MIFRTELNPTPASEKFDHSCGIITIGSCFAEVIGNKLAENKFKTLNNPFGTIFNPLSIAKLLESCISGKPLSETSYLHCNHNWYNYQLHSSVIAPSREQLSLLINSIFSRTRSHILSDRILIITLGTAWVYKLSESAETVANCHKQPSRLFEKILLEPEEIIKSLIFSLNLAKDLNPGLKVIITVSPVRHTKDTLTLNSVSKSILRYAAHKLTETLPFCEYFPAYELMNDDLRDYRFYKEDLIHPTAQAENYIWEKFSDTYFSEPTIKTLKKWELLKKALRHNPFNQTTDEYKKFLSSTLRKLEEISESLEVSAEIAEVSEKLSAL
jgi:hypothetical protein